MAWRKRRRYRLANIISYFCTFFGVVFILGNVIMLREGFVQLYSTTFGGRTSFQNHYVYADDPRNAHRDKWRENRASNTFMDSLHVELPSSVLNGELRLRKLMENENNIGFRPRPKYPSQHEYNFVNEKKTSKMKQKGDLSVISISSRDLRQSLYDTSDCSGLQNSTYLNTIGSGWTKMVFQTTYNGQPAALKTVDPAGHDIATCLEENRGWSQAQCYEKATQKVLKEIVLLQGLQHPHIVQVLGHCVPDTSYYGNTVTMATELGESVDIIKLLHLSWENRLRIAYGLTKLLQYLAHSPYGSVVLNDFRRQQFVLVNGDLKLTDIDDMGFQETSCLLDLDCQQYYSSANVTLRAKCIGHRCMGLNEKKNIFNAARHFTTFLLPHGAPHALRPIVDQLVDHFINASKTSVELIKDLAVIVKAYSSGSYLDKTNRLQTNYHMISESDLPGQYDYSCKYCMDGTGCTVSVYDQNEAESLCDDDAQCKGFVLTQTRTWTGRMIAHLKHGMGTLVRNTKTNVFIKPASPI